MTGGLLDALFPGRPALGWESCARTDVGRARGHNEDAVFVSDRKRVFVVADGMGGGEMGEVASRCVVQAVDAVPLLHYPPVLEIQEAARKANEHLLGLRSGDRAHQIVGSTLVCLCLPPLPSAAAVLLHAGDSRAYRLRRRCLRVLTRDHSLDAEFRSKHEKTPAMYRSVITRAIGVRETLTLEQTRVDIRAGDLLLLCSDGLYNMLPRRRLRRILLSLAGRPLPVIAARLIDQANAAGGRDNISVVLVRLLDRESSPVEEGLPETETAPTRKTAVAGRGD